MHADVRLCRARLRLLIHALRFYSSLFVLELRRSPPKVAFVHVHRFAAASVPLRPSPLSPPRMQTYTPQHKHDILSHYRVGSRDASFRALARRFAVQGGDAVILRWYQRWDGTPQSLEHKRGAGRPRSLSKKEVQQHVRTPILRANRAHKAVHYPAVAEAVRQKTGREVSLRTVQRYGKEELGAKQRRGKKRTAEESECTHIGIVLHVHRAACASC